jgi:hypothetical protein
MRRSLIRRAGHVGVAVAAVFATSLLALPMTSAAAGPKKQPAATLVVQKVVGFQSETGFTVQVVCNETDSGKVNSQSNPDASLPYNSDGTPDDSASIPGWNVVDNAWVYDFWSWGGVTCTATETDQGDAAVVTYGCSWDPGDQEWGATLGVENPGCPGDSAGPSFNPEWTGTVTLEGCGDTGTLTVYNDLYDPTLPHTNPGTIPSGNPPVTTTTTTTPVTPVTPVTPAKPAVAPAAAAVVASAHFTG